MKLPAMERHEDIDRYSQTNARHPRPRPWRQGVDSSGSGPASFCQKIAHPLGERALMVCLVREADFSGIIPLVAHPKAKYDFALRLRTFCRRTLPLGSSLHLRLCQQLLKHRETKVRNHIVRLARYDGHTIWRASGRADSEITGESTARGRDGHHWAECRCDSVRDIVEEKMLPCLSNVLGQEELRRWLLPSRKTIWMCGCGSFL